MLKDSYYDSRINQTVVYYTDSDEYLSEIGMSENTFEDEIQSDYNEMVQSVKSNGGFYVSRYEISEENGKASSKPGKLPITNKSWYKLYQLATTYTNKEYTNSVKCEMIWGSQYDAMLNFSIETGTDKEKIFESFENGSHSEIVKTGAYKGSDSILNIYDLEGNATEWTQEALVASRYRMSRGGLTCNVPDSNYESSPSDQLMHLGPASLWNERPSQGSNIISTRATLYIK